MGRDFYASQAGRPTSIRDGVFLEIHLVGASHALEKNETIKKMQIIKNATIHILPDVRLIQSSVVSAVKLKE